MSVRLIVLSLHFIYPLLANNARYFSTIQFTMFPSSLCQAKIALIGLKLQTILKVHLSIKQFCIKEKEPDCEKQEPSLASFSFPNVQF